MSKRITWYRLKWTVYLIKKHNLNGTVYICGKYMKGYMQDYLINQGIKNEMIMLNSTTTYEDALLSKEKLINCPEETVIITSLSHQRRAHKTFVRVYEKDHFINKPTWFELLSIYSPLLPTGWLAVFWNIVKDFRYDK